jgi:hypothetical protein
LRLKDREAARTDVMTCAFVRPIEELDLKYIKLFLLFLPILVSCIATQGVPPTVTPAPEQLTRRASTSVPIPTRTLPSPGTIEGTISWLTSTDSTKIPISSVNLELNGHLEDLPRYTARTDENGHYSFANIEPNNYGLGVYLSLPVSKRLCEAPEYQYNYDLGWTHYATALRGDIWYDILFSNEDIVLAPGEIVFVNFLLKCP